MHTFNPSSWEAEAGRSLSLRPTGSTALVLEQPGLHREILSSKQNKTKKPGTLHHCISQCWATLVLSPAPKLLQKVTKTTPALRLGGPCAWRFHSVLLLYSLRQPGRCAEAREVCMLTQTILCVLVRPAGTNHSLHRRVFSPLLSKQRQ